MWVVAIYHQVSLFSLKPARDTSTGGRSLLIPTPFSIKMALLDVALRTYGTTYGSSYFPLIRDLGVAVSPPPRMIVNNCFMRIQKPRREKGGKEEAKQDERDTESVGPFTLSVAFREYVQYSGPLGLAVTANKQQDVDLLTMLLTQVSYFGKRGSFFQLDSPPYTADDLPVKQGYFRLDSPEYDDTKNTSLSTLQELDDCSSALTFERANVYGERSRKTTITLGKERILRPIVIPYTLRKSSKGFSLYERVIQMYKKGPSQ